MFFFFFNDTATTEIYTLSLHDALPIYEAVSAEDLHAFLGRAHRNLRGVELGHRRELRHALARVLDGRGAMAEQRSEEHTSELQSRQYLVCRLLLEKKRVLLHNDINDQV